MCFNIHDVTVNVTYADVSQNFISRTRGSSGHLEKIPTVNNGNFTKKCGNI